MAMPALDDALDEFFAKLTYSQVTLEEAEDKSVNEYGMRIEPHHGAIRKTVEDRNAARASVTRAQARCDVRWRRFVGEYEIAQRGVEGVFSRTPDDARRYFPMTTPVLGRTGIESRLATVRGEIIDKWTKPSPPAEVKKVLAPAEGRWKAYVEAMDALGKAETTFTEADNTVTEALKAAIATMVEVHGLLEAKFKLRPAEAEDYFRKRPTAKKRKVVDPEKGPSKPDPAVPAPPVPGK